MEYRSLPVDLAEDILSRVSAKYLARLRSTSKHWNALLKSGSFAKTQSAKAPKEESLIIMLMDFRVYLVRVDLRGIHGNEDAPTLKVATQFYFKDPLSNSNTSQVDIRNVFHCDGLLLCTTRDKRLVLWNPCSGETKWIQPRDSYKESDYYALGYDSRSSCKKYKILRVDRLDDVRPMKNEYEIYDLASNSWRVVGVATDWFLPLYRRGVSVKGNTYWVAIDTAQEVDEFVLSFDFSTERFQSLSLPLPSPFSYSKASLSVVGEEQLCLLGTDRKFWIRLVHNDFQVWVATSTGSVMSWSKSLTVKGYYGHYKFSDGMSFLADEQNKVVMYLSPNNMLHIVGEDKHTQVDDLVGDFTSIWSCSVLLNYVPSLAQIQQDSLPRGLERKAPST